MNQIFDDAKNEEVFVLTPEMFEEITNDLRVHAAEVLVKFIQNLPDNPAYEDLKVYFPVFSGAYHVLTCSLMHVTGQITSDRFREMITPFLGGLVKFLQDAKASGKMK